MSTYSGPYTGPVGEVSAQERRRIVESVVGGVEWDRDGEWGYCTCPGLTNHNHKNGRRDCRAFAIERHGGRNGLLPPGVHCLHTSCLGAVEEASKRIRSEIGKAKAKAGAAMGGRGGLAPRSQAQSSAQKGSGAALSAGKGASGSPVPPTESRTLRTPVFEVRSKQGGDSRTKRTEVGRPLTQFAHVRTHTCFKDTGKDASEVSATEVAKTEQLPSQPVPFAAGEPGPDSVFNPATLRWESRAEWEAELRNRPVK